MKKLDEERSLEELIKFDTGKNRMYVSKQLDTFHNLHTEPSEWSNCKIDHWEMDEKNNEHPIYRLTSNREVTPYDDHNPMRSIKQVYSFNNSLNLNHIHKNNCQLCGTPILINYRIQCDRLQIDMVVGSECVKNYQILQGNLDADNGEQIFKKAKNEILSKEIFKKVEKFSNDIGKQLTKSIGWKKLESKYPGICKICNERINVHDIILWSPIKNIEEYRGVKHEKCAKINEIQCISYVKNKRFLQFIEQLKAVTPVTSIAKIKALIKKASNYGLKTDEELSDLIQQISRKSKNIQKTGLDSFI